MDDSKTVAEIEKEMKYQKVAADRIERQIREIEENKINAIDCMREIIRELISVVNLSMPRGLDCDDHCLRKSFVQPIRITKNN